MGYKWAYHFFQHSRLYIYIYKMDQLDSKFFLQQYPILTRENNYFYVHYYCCNLYINDVKTIEEEYNRMNIPYRLYNLGRAFVYYKFIELFSPELLKNINKVKNLKKNFNTFIYTNGDQNQKDKYTTIAEKSNENC
jgi:hypothetical protein